MAYCYTGMRHERAGDSVRRGDCVLLRAGSRRTEAPFVAKVAQLWENPEDGNKDDKFFIIYINILINIAKFSFHL